MIKQEEIRVSEFKVRVIKYLWNGMPVVVYEATQPAEVYTIPIVVNVEWGLPYREGTNVN